MILNFRSLPWPQQTLLGYFIEVVLSIVSTQMYLIPNGAFLLLFISFCLFYEAFYMQFWHFARKLNQSRHNEDQKKNTVELIAYHNSVKMYWTLEETMITQ